MNAGVAVDPVLVETHPWVGHRVGAIPSFGLEHRRHPGAEIDVVRMRHDRAEVTDPEPDKLCFVLPLEADGGVVEASYGEGWIRVPARRGVVHVAPMGVGGAFRLPRCSLFMICVDFAEFLDWVEGAELGEATYPRLAGGVHDVPQAADLASVMWAAAGSEDAAAGLAVQSAFNLLLALMLRRAGDPRLFDPPPRVEGARMARVVDHVEARIDAALSVPELAKVACLSVFHFGRAFKAAVGETPHRYVMTRRIERAKELLATTDLDVTSVALATGFASHSHMTGCFRGRVGVPPGEWRRRARG